MGNETILAVWAVRESSQITEAKPPERLIGFMKSLSVEFNEMEGASQSLRSDLFAGSALRHEVFNKITPILLQSNSIPDSRIRLVIQACCLDIVTILEDLIEEYDLDRCERSGSTK